MDFDYELDACERGEMPEEEYEPDSNELDRRDYEADIRSGFDFTPQDWSDTPSYE